MKVNEPLMCDEPKPSSFNDSIQSAKQAIFTSSISSLTIKFGRDIKKIKAIIKQGSCFLGIADDLHN